LAKSQNRQDFKEASPLPLQRRGDRTQKDKFCPSSGMHASAALFPHPSEGGQGGGFIFGKAPPDQARSPGAGRGHPPENKAGPPIGSPNLSKGGISQNQNENQIFNKKYKSNFSNNLNLKIMKKQFLFLVFLVLAAFAGVNRSYGQCSPTSLTPQPGVSFPYGIAITSTGTGGTYLWYVTSGVNLLTAAKLDPVTDAFFTVDAAGSAYNNTTGGTNTLRLIWTPKAVAGLFYVVVKYTETSTTGCLVEQMRSFEVKPINTFLLAVAGSDLTGDVLKASTCPAPITGALVTAATPTVAYTYGQNSLYYKVTASGILGSWRPSIRIPALGTLSQNYANADWTSDGGNTWHTFGLTAGNTAGGDFISTDNATITDVSAGTPIIVRLQIENANNETTTAQPITIGVDGHLPTLYAVSDIVGGAGATACDPEAVFGKTGTFTIQARPTAALGTLTGTGGFIPKLP
jgi:hypothetical protein